MTGANEFESDALFSSRNYLLLPPSGSHKVATKDDQPNEEERFDRAIESKPNESSRITACFQQMQPLMRKTSDIKLHRLLQLWGPLHRLNQDRSLALL